MAPGLFIAGVVFGYFVVLPAATKFLLNFNDNQFNIQIRARDYYSFFTLTLAVMGLIFQLPIAILAVTRLGIVTPEQLSQNRRYAYVILIVVAALLPGTDPVTMLIEAVPLHPALRGERSARQGLRQTARRGGGTRDRRLRAAAQRRGLVAHRDPLRFSAVLFDLQSPRRRRVIRVTFGGLAAIFAISFVFLGVGTGGGGFSFSDLFGSGGSSSSANAFDDDIKTAEQQIAVNPADTAALARLVQLQYSAANANTDSNGAPTSEGEQHLQEAADAWNKYVKVSKGNPNPSTAVYALNTFDLLARLDFAKARGDTSTADALTDVTAAVDSWKTAAQAQQVLIDAQPNKATSNVYANLAQYLYLAGETQAADQAVAKAKQGAKGSDASTIDQQFSSIKQLGQQLQTAIKQLTKQQQQTQGGAPGAGGGSNPLAAIRSAGSAPAGSSYRNPSYNFALHRAVSSAGRAGDS